MKGKLSEESIVARTANKYVVYYMDPDGMNQIPLAVYEEEKDAKAYIRFLEKVFERKLRLYIRYQEESSRALLDLGHPRREKFEGRTYGGWQILAMADRSFGPQKYWCRCKGCGKIILRSVYPIKSGKSRYCDNCYKEGRKENGSKAFGPYVIKLTQEERKTVHGRYGGHCAYCGRQISISQMEISVTSKMKYAQKNDLNMILPSCRICNRGRKTKSIMQYRMDIRSAHEILLRYKSLYGLAARFHKVQWTGDNFKFYFEQEENGCEQKSSGTARENDYL